MIDDVRTAFSALRARPATADDQQLAVLAVAGVAGAYVGLDDQHQPHLLLATNEDDVPASEVATMDIEVRTLVIGGERASFLDVVCLYQAVAEVFDHFVVAVLDRLVISDESAGEVLTSVLLDWRRFLVLAGGVPGRERLAEVFGELLVVLDVVRASSKPRVDFWVGPMGARHDLRRGSVALEVKTTRSHTGRRVTIHGEDQLLPPDGGWLHLHLIRLEEVAGAGRTVASLVDELLTAGAPAEGLFDRLAVSGISPADLAATEAVGFDVLERLTVTVDDEMPRIVPATFAEGARPVGVDDLTYAVDLDHCLDRALDQAAYADLVVALGSAT